MALGDSVETPDTRRIVSPDTGNLSPEWRDTVEELVDLVNELSTELKALKEQVNG